MHWCLGQPQILSDIHGFGGPCWGPWRENRHVGCKSFICVLLEELPSLKLTAPSHLKMGGTRRLFSFSFWDGATLAELLVSGSVLVLTTCIWLGFTGIFPSCQLPVRRHRFLRSHFYGSWKWSGLKKGWDKHLPTRLWVCLEHFCPAADWKWGQIFARQGAFPSTIIEWRRLEHFCWHLRSLVITCERKHFFDCFSAKDTGGRKMQRFACWGMDQAEKKSWEMYKSLNNWYNIESKAQQFASTVQTCNELYWYVVELSSDPGFIFCHVQAPTAAICFCHCLWRCCRGYQWSYHNYCCQWSCGPDVFGWWLPWLSDGGGEFGQSSVHEM